MLINLTNHPSDKWPERQLMLAKKLYNEIYDLPFPNVPPEADEEDIKRLADDYLQKILPLNPQAVHIQGEFTFTYRMINLLKEHGIKCIASTTSRIVKENSDGSRTYHFEFVRFREYV
jgi:NAD(P)H-flavin reductase